MTPLPQTEAFRGDLLLVFDEIMRSSHLSEGKFVVKLEEAVSEWCGMHAVAVNSAGSGLFALMSQYGQQEEGKEYAPQVVVCTNTFAATGTMPVEAGWGVQLADCGQFDFSMSLQTLEAAVTEETDAVIITHCGGMLARDYEEIASFCEERSLLLLEDAAHVFGVKEKGITAGHYGEAAVFSLYPTKAIPAGEGGIIVTRDSELAEELRVFRNYGKYKEDGVIKYSRGFNLRMDEWTAGVAYVQMKRMEEILDRRQDQAARLHSVIAPAYPGFDRETNWYKYPVDITGKYGEVNFIRQAGKVYQVSDQLTAVLWDTEPLPNSDRSYGSLLT